MIVSIFGILIVTAGLMILPAIQLIPTILAQKDAFIESTAENTTASTLGNTTASTLGNTTASTLGNTTASTLGNITESLEEEELQQSGTISRKHN
jgi:hypothetical protein